MLLYNTLPRSHRITTFLARPKRRSNSSLAATAALSLGAGLWLSYLPGFLGPPHFLVASCYLAVTARYNCTMPAESEIHRRIAEKGPVTFAEFMEVALYWPGGGYYSKRDPIGGSGDYYTSPLAHPAFGALLAVQLFQMWRLLERPSTFHVIEPGAGSGRLCRDMVSFASQLPEGFGDNLRYVCVDRGIAREEGASEAGVHRVVSTGLPFQPVEGCVLSNELLDAFPVHQVISRGGLLKEVYVTVDGDSLTTVVGEPSTTRLANRLDSLSIRLQEGQTAEVNLGLDRWVEEASQTLSRGFVLTVDYGRTAADLYSAEHRFRGALTTFYRHTQTDAPLQRIGLQDMTAQVDFSSLIELGRRQGLEPIGYTNQSDFLTKLGLARFRRRLSSLGLTQREFVANNSGMLDLARAGGLGDFKVLAQGKNVGNPALWGFNATEEAFATTELSPVPLLSNRHLRVAEARYPYVGLEFDDFLGLVDPELDGFPPPPSPSRG